MKALALLALGLALLGGCAATDVASLDPAPLVAAAPPAERHSLTAIAGLALNRADDGFTVGGVYENRLKENLGVGAFGDVTFGDETATVLGGAVFYHPKERIVLFGGPGVEFYDGDSGALVRLGGWYEFPMEDLVLSPLAFVDLGRGDAVVFLGFGVGWRF
jgi:hypothetical protein